VDEERRSAPLAVELPGDVGADAWVSTDASRPLAVEAGGTLGRSLARGPLPAVPSWSAWANLTLRPHPRIETQLNVSYGRTAWPVRWVTDGGSDEPADRRFLLAQLSAPALSVTLRHQLVLTPRLTLQAYAQLYSSYGRYHDFRVASARRGRIALADLDTELDDPAGDPTTATWWDNPDFRTTTLNVTAVLRWEYRLGSTLFLVYSRAQQELGYPDDPHDPSPPHTVRPIRLGAGPTTDTFLVKWSYRWSR
jgi:hypothetical protein